MVKRCIDAIAYRIQYYAKKRVFLERNKKSIFRIFIYALAKEIYVYSSLFFKKSNKPRTKFVIFAQSRAGKTLLTDLLKSNPQIQCAEEILSLNVFFQKLIIKGACALSKKNAYGFQLKILDLIKTQNIRDPKQFMLDLCIEGCENNLHKKTQCFPSGSCGNNCKRKK